MLLGENPSPPSGTLPSHEDLEQRVKRLKTPLEVKQVSAVGDKQKTEQLSAVGEQEKVGDTQEDVGADEILTMRYLYFRESAGTDVSLDSESADVVGEILRPPSETCPTQDDLENCLERLKKTLAVLEDKQDGGAGDIHVKYMRMRVSYIEALATGSKTESSAVGDNSAKRETDSSTDGDKHASRSEKESSAVGDKNATASPLDRSRLGRLGGVSVFAHESELWRALEARGSELWRA